MNHFVVAGDNTLFDVGVIGVLLASLMIGLVNGLIKELSSMGLWLIAGAGAVYAGPLMTDLIPVSVESSKLRLLASGALAYFGLYFSIRFMIRGLTALVEAAELKPLDRLLGLVFGVVRASLILMVLTAVIVSTQLSQQPFWIDAVTRPWLERGLALGRPLLPESTEQWIQSVGVR